MRLYVARIALIAIVAALAACGGPSASTLHDQHAGKTIAEIRAALGAPENSETLPNADETAPARERMFYKKGKALGIDDPDNTYIAVEFEGGKETRMYEVSAEDHKKIFRDFE
ncbi:MAG TPA: hypothetical protein VEL07_00280 [Planctomycetota bacterium]|nr:hypothetical protein [Planctomycetota bacterium]